MDLLNTSTMSPPGVSYGLHVFWRLAGDLARGRGIYAGWVHFFLKNSAITYVETRAPALPICALRTWRGNARRVRHVQWSTTMGLGRSRPPRSSFTAKTALLCVCVCVCAFLYSSVLCLLNCCQALWTGTCICHGCLVYVNAGSFFFFGGGRVI